MEAARPAPAPTDGKAWRDMFANWPETISRRGIVVNQLNEAMPFKGFLIRDDMIVLERQNPDSLGARYILLSFDTIIAVKLLDPLQAEAFTPLGFTGRFSVG